MQKVDDQLQPIAFASRILTDTEKGYAQIEKETLASVYACEKFENYLIGLDSFELQTDHKPLVPLIKTNDLDKTPARCQRLLMRRMRFNPVAVHVPEKDLVIADALSRHPQNHTIDEMELEENVQAYVDAIVESWPTSTPRLQTLRHETARDPELQKVSHYVMTGWPSKIPEDLQHYQQNQGDLSQVNGLLVLNNRIVIPKSQRRNILKTLHETHQGIEKCRQKAQMSVWWPGLNKEIKDMINNCRECRESRPSQKNEPLNPTQLPERPWQKVGTDLCSRNNKEYLIAVGYYSR